jgi:coenzyme F420-reducing hydrogenase alpha subunit
MTARPEGRIRIDLSASGGKGRARIENTRPLSLANQFSGRRPGEVASLVPLVFSICRAAQSAACAGALERALPAPVCPREIATRTLLTLGETAREHALQVLHSWPQCLKAAEPAMASASIKQLLKIDRELTHCLAGASRLGAFDKAEALRAISGLTALLGEAVYGELPSEWLSRQDFEDLASWAQRNETPAQTVTGYLIQSGMADAGAADIDPLPPLQPDKLEATLFGDGARAFIAQPEWEGRPRETTPLSRVAETRLAVAVKDRCGTGLLARLVACLIELAGLPDRMLALTRTLSEVPEEALAPAAANATGTGSGTAEAARGRLVHAVDIEDGLVRRYRILAPTEWNFHPEGAAARGLAAIALSAPSRREVLARLFITAVDPCVGYDLRLS